MVSARDLLREGLLSSEGLGTGELSSGKVGHVEEAGGEGWKEDGVGGTEEEDAEALAFSFSSACEVRRQV